MSDLDNMHYDYIQRVRKVMLYIESHLDEQLELQKLAKIAAFSPFHFYRIFRSLVGESLSEYLRRLRLDRAALQLRAGQKNIITIALEAGYETHSSFSKAFKKHLGKTPSSYRHEGKEQNLLINLKTLNQGIKMDAEIIETENINVLFIRRTGNYCASAPDATKTLWSQLGNQGIDIQAQQYYGIAHDDPDITKEEQVRYDACVAKAVGMKISGELSEQNIPGGKHVRFVHKGTLTKLSETYDYIYGHWLPNSGKQLADRPCVLEYIHKPDCLDEDKWVTNVYLPLA